MIPDTKNREAKSQYQLLTTIVPVLPLRLYDEQALFGDYGYFGAGGEAEVVKTFAVETNFGNGHGLYMATTFGLDGEAPDFRMREGGFGLFLLLVCSHNSLED